jgi:putative transposase
LGNFLLNCGNKQWKIFHELARHRESKIVEGHLCPDHIHMLIEIPPKYAVSGVVGYIKGKSAIAIARTYLGKRQNFTGQNFWARGYYVSTVGRDEQAIRKYIQEQEAEDKRQEQLELFKDGEQRWGCPKSESSPSIFSQQDKIHAMLYP